VKRPWKAIFQPVMPWVTAASLLSLIGAQTPEVEQTSANSQRSTPSGVTFIAPGGWSIRANASSVVLDAPEKDSHVVITDVRATDAAGAVVTAWAAYRPETNRPIKLATPIPALDGWDERLTFAYEVSPNERAVVAAIASRVGDVWTVAIIDGTVPTFEKRGAQLSLILTNLHPKGYQRESFAERKALPLNHERTEQLKSFVEVSMKKLGIPGASLALIDGGQVVYEGGLGVRELGHPFSVELSVPRARARFFRVRSHGSKMERRAPYLDTSRGECARCTRYTARRPAGPSGYYQRRPFSRDPALPIC
jgi:hypothetical protein